MKVCIAEKPSVAREIAYILQAKNKRDGYIEGNGYAVTWTFGHFCTLKTPDDYQAEWKKWDLGTLPMLPAKFDIKLIANKGVKKQFGIIKKLLKQAEIVINCGDAGQEGELIQRWVLKEAKYKGNVQRLWISSLTPEAIREGFRNLKDATYFDNLYYAGFSRAIGDWLLGMNATRLYTLKYGGYKQVLSVGRVQTPTLAMLVARHKEIENFVPQPYWELQTIYREVVFNCTKGRFLKKEAGETLLNHVEGKPFMIISFEKKNAKEYPPKLFDLTSLQVHCNKRFSYSADLTLKIAQKLYEQKVITYPRVDTTYLPNDMYPKVAGILRKMTDYQTFTQPLLGKKIRKSAKVFNDKKVTDHHAIIPTGVQRSLGQNEQNVYDAIARQFIAAFYPDCLVAKTTVIGEADGVRFKATGKEILEEGWRVLFPKPAKKATSNANDKEEKKGEEEKILPKFEVDESGHHEPSLVEKETKPPKTYSEATLLRAMETAGKKVDDDELRELMKANGIGRPSTRANIIETLFKRKYIERKKKQILPTSTGIQLIDIIENDLLKSAELTGQWEKQLREIETGTYHAKQFISGMKQMVSSLVAEVKQAQATVKIVASPKSSFSKSKKRSKARIADNTKKSSPSKPTSSTSNKSKHLEELSCPKCRQGKLIKGKTAYGCSRWKENCDFRLPFAFKDKKLSENQLFRLMQKGETVKLKGFKEGGEKVNGKVTFNREFEMVLEVQEEIKKAPSKLIKSSKIPDKIPCPTCQKGTVIKGKTAYGCSRWKEGCGFRFPFEEIRQRAGGQKLTKELVWGILNG